MTRISAGTSIAAPSIPLAASIPAAPPWPLRSSRELINRMTFGYNQAEEALFRSLGPAGYIEYHLAYESIDDSAMNAMLTTPAYSTLTQTALDLYNLQLTSFSTPINQVTRATLLRAIFSKRQLYERMVEFWSDHFNINITNSENQNYLKPIDDRDVIRVNPLGRFVDLLRASAKSPAMLRFLDNNANIAAAPNENYARELMELHTIGVGGGYNQGDVTAVAKCFTGWTYWPVSAGAPTALTFRYDNSKHDQTVKNIFVGTPQQIQIPASGGQNDGETIINALAAHPSCARFISTKLLTRFYGENPPPDIITLVSGVFTATQGDIRVVMRTILNLLLPVPPQLKFKRPMHLLMSALRGLNATVPNDPSSLQSTLNNIGHVPFGWVPPDGYPDTVAYWAGNQLGRWNFGASLMNNEYSGTSVDAATLFAGYTTAGAIADRIAQLLMPAGIAPTDRAAIVAYLGTGTPTLTRIREAVGLAIASPSFQWY